MQEYDVTLKLLLQQRARVTMQALTGTVIEKWLDVELPKVQNPRVDLLGEGVGGDLVHLELQSTNDQSMALRMAEYWLAVYRLLGRFPRQIVLYVGNAALKMERELRGPGGWFQFSAVDIRELDGERLLASEDIGDNVIAILAKLRDQRDAVRLILNRIAALPVQQKRLALDQLLILAGLRKLTEAVEQEVRAVPIQIDYMETRWSRATIGEAKKKAVKKAVKKVVRKVVKRGNSRSCGGKLKNALAPFPIGLMQSLPSALPLNLKNWACGYSMPRASKICLTRFVGFALYFQSAVNTLNS